MDRLQNIVIGVDFSEYSKVALEQAKRIARWNQSDLHFIHVVDKMVVGDLQKAVGSSLEKITQDVARTTRERINELFAEDPLERRKDMPQSGTEGPSERRTCDVRRIELKPDVIVGDPFEEILNRVRKVKGDLLMLGSNGASSPIRGLGALATACVRKAECRVMIIRETHAKPFTLVTACIDFSRSSAPVVEQAIRVARQDHARLHLVHVFQPPWDRLHYRSPTTASSPDFQRQYKDNLSAELGQFIHKHQGDIKGLDVESHIIESQKPADGIIEYVQNTGADLVVVGTRGRTGVKRLLLGTQAEKIVHHTPVSVLVIKPED